ncbi:MAG: chromosomal replication initiator protein DnaA [Deltaproteobacteria bacterium]|nr:chromosomal replication initiator protein DnaA [Deltaproteobacteria bacterium]
MTELWESTLKGIRERVNEQSFKTWLAPLKLVSVKNDLVEIQVPNKFFEDWINENYISMIKEELFKNARKPYEILFKIAEQQAQQMLNLSQNASTNPPVKTGISLSKSSPMINSQNISHNKPPLQSTQDVKIFDSATPVRASGGDYINPKYTFDSFVVGSSNQFAHAAAFAVAEQPARNYNPLFVFGGVGLGKTHLVNAIGNHALKKQPHLKVCFVSSEKFVNELINCLRYEKMDVFRKKYREGYDILLMDDIQFIAGKDRTQEEFFHTFNTLHSSRRQIVVTSDKYPKDIPFLEERLRTRFEWGLIADIQPPEMETRLAILKNKAELDDIYLPDEVGIFLASNIKSNVRELEGSLIRVGAFASLTGMEITVDLAKEILKNIIKDKDREVTIENIQKATCSFFDMKILDLKSKKKNKLLSTPRQIAMFLCRKHTKESFPEIGKRFGGKDHSTVIHAVSKITEELSKDVALRNTIASIERLVDV